MYRINQFLLLIAYNKRIQDYQRQMNLNEAHRTLQLDCVTTSLCQEIIGLSCIVKVMVIRGLCCIFLVE